MLYCIYIKVDSSETMTIIDKAECLVHYSHIQSSKKLMLVDPQGAGYHLYDPEIATSELRAESGEAYFCCGNVSYLSIEEFMDNHICNKFCAMVNKVESSSP